MSRSPDPRAADVRAVSQVAIPQYGRRAIVAVWAAAVLPMAAFAWLVAPWLAERLDGVGSVPLAKALLLVLTAGLTSAAFCCRA